jgi:hypothetical protein
MIFLLSGPGRDPNLIPENIKYGVTIYGVAGTLAGGYLILSITVPTLYVPAVPTVAPPTTSVIAESPISETVPTITVPDVPTVSVSSAVVIFIELANVSISNGTPCVITKAGHGIGDHTILYFKTTGALPTGITQYQYYYCDYVGVDTFRITSSIGGANINTSSAGSGVHSCWYVGELKTRVDTAGNTRVTSTGDTRVAYA